MTRACANVEEHQKTDLAQNAQLKCSEITLFPVDAQ